MVRYENGKPLYGYATHSYVHVRSDFIHTDLLLMVLHSLECKTLKSVSLWPEWTGLLEQPNELSTYRLGIRALRVSTRLVEELSGHALLDLLISGGFRPPSWNHRLCFYFDLFSICSSTQQLLKFRVHLIAFSAARTSRLAIKRTSCIYIAVAH